MLEHPSGERDIALAAGRRQGAVSRLGRIAPVDGHGAERWGAVDPAPVLLDEAGYRLRSRTVASAECV